MDGVVITMLIALFVMSTASAIYCSQWISNSSHNHWYLEVDLQDITFNPDNKVMVGVVSFFTSYVLYGYLIPISLYVSLEIVKVFQGFVFLNKDAPCIPPGGGHSGARQNDESQRRTRHGAHCVE